MAAVWTIEEAQTQLPKVIDLAVTIGPQKIARNGNPLVTVVASQEWDEMLRKEADAATFGQRLQDAAQSQTGGLKNYICG